MNLRVFKNLENNYHLASLHLLLCTTQDAARTLANVMFDWSKLDEEGKTCLGRYAARGVLRFVLNSLHSIYRSDMLQLVTLNSRLYFQHEHSSLISFPLL